MFLIIFFRSTNAFDFQFKSSQQQYQNRLLYDQRFNLLIQKQRVYFIENNQKSFFKKKIQKNQNKYDYDYVSHKNQFKKKFHEQIYHEN